MPKIKKDVISVTRSVRKIHKTIVHSQKCKNVVTVLEPAATHWFSLLIGRKFLIVFSQCSSFCLFVDVKALGSLCRNTL
jgi:hypothetical protein